MQSAGLSCTTTRSRMWVVLRVRGQAAHLGVAYNGVNAIDLASNYIAAFHELGHQLDCEYRHPLWRSHPAGHVFSVTQITSEPSPGSVPSACEVKFSAGYMAGESRADVLERVRSVFDRVTSSNDWLAEHPPEIAIAGPLIDPAATPIDHSLVRDLQSAPKDLGFAEPEVHALSAGTDGRFLGEAGMTGVVNFGPGNMARGHGPDEFIELNEFQRAIVWTAVTVARYCGVEDTDDRTDLDV